MKAYKGFHRNTDGTLKCLEKIYLPGETYTEDTAELCVTGMHACLAPIDVLSYYPPATCCSWPATSSKRTAPASACAACV